MMYIGDRVRNKLNGIEGNISSIDGIIAGNQQYAVSVNVGGTHMYSEGSLEVI